MIASTNSRAGIILRLYTILLFSLLPFFVHAQEKGELAHHLIGIPGYAFSPLKGNYFLFGLECSTFTFTALPGEVHPVIPYTYTDNQSNSASGVFRGAASILPQPSHAEARTLLNFEMQIARGPVMVLKVSVLSEKGIFGRFNNLDYYEWALRYNFAFFPKKSAPRFIISPALGFAGHELDYSLGTDTINGTSAVILGKKIKLSSDSPGLEMGYSSKYYMLHPSLGIWFLPSHHRRTDAADDITLPYWSFRLEAGYNMLLWSRQLFCFANSDAIYTKIGKEQTSSDPSPKQLVNLNSFKGVTFGFTVLLRPYK